MVAIREFETQPTDLFGETLMSLKRRLSLFVWQGFFESLSFVSLHHNTLTISAPSTFHKDWVRNHYFAELQDAVTRIYGRSLNIEIVEGMEPQAPMMAPEPYLPPPVATLSETISPLKASNPTGVSHAPVAMESIALNPANTFETFVVGPSNQMGSSACLAVAEHPGAQYSPLFLFGPAGIGKTHLVHAIGLQALANNPNTKILYMTAEQWVNAYILAIREKRFDAFRKKFRSDCDILLIDDIQFLAGKDASQDEFFHTFNSLHQAHKQIVVTSDKYPHEIQGLEERLQTRLSWGLIADIRPPEYETRKAILQQKAQRCGINLPEDVAQYLATNITSSVRELEGSLLRLSAFSKVSKHGISLAGAKDYLSPVLKRNIGALTPDRICDHVAAYYDLKPVELKGQSRQRQVALARQVAMALCRNMMAFSMPEIGRFFGNRDHTTVLSSLRKIDDLRETDISIQTVLSKLEKSLVEAC